MIKTFLLLAFRIFLKNKVFLLINIVGLGTSLGCCIVAYLNFRFEHNFNRMHPNQEQIYVINSIQKVDNKQKVHAYTPVALGTVVREKVNGNTVIRFMRSELPLSCTKQNKGTQIMSEDICFSDRELFDLFDFPMKWGDYKSFNDPGTILLSESTSANFFGNLNPTGKFVTVYNEQGKATIFTIGGVFKDVPHNSIVRFNAITRYSNYESMFGVDVLSWKDWTTATFIEVKNRNQVHEIDKAINQFVEIQNNHRKDWKVEKFQLTSLKEFTQNSYQVLSNNLGVSLHPAQTITLILMALLLLLLSCFNYVNTYLAISSRRLKEVGIRKVVGCARHTLILQFIGENLILCIGALLLSLYFAALLGEQYNMMLAYDIVDKRDIFGPEIWSFLLILLILTVLLSAAYPAFYISSFNPVPILKGAVKFSVSNGFTKVLLTMQLCIALIGLISSIAFAGNAKYLKNFEFGYNKNQVIFIAGVPSAQMERFTNAAKHLPGVTGVISSGSHITMKPASASIRYIDTYSEADVYDVSPGYCKFMDITVLDGREFSPGYRTSDLHRSVLINETLAREFKWDEPLGKNIEIDTLKYIVAGVVKDFYRNLYEPVSPIIMRLAPDEQIKTLLIKGETNKLTKINEALKKEWEKLVPYAPYEGAIGSLSYLYSQINNGNILKIFNFLSIIAILLTITTLYTLIALQLIKRTKEIGIRKVFGATSRHINYIITKPFLPILLIASIPGAFCGYYLTQALLNSVWEHHIKLNSIMVMVPVVFLFFTGITTLLIRIHFSLKQNPINSLRYE
jgi:putative ABC transport system permease protein